MDDANPPPVSPSNTTPRVWSKFLVKVGRIIIILAVIHAATFVIYSTYHHVTRRTGGYGSSDTVAALNVRSAIASYYTEYRKFPVSTDDASDGDFLTDHTLMDILLGSEKLDEMNPRRIVFFAGRNARSNRRGVTADEHGGGELWDSWGNYYHVRIDLDRDNQVAEPNHSKSKTPVMVPQSIIVWSAGKDGVEGTSDDIKSW